MGGDGWLFDGEVSKAVAERVRMVRVVVVEDV